ncbi:hypothetical protein SAMN05444064_103386 [Pseudomonas syringae]|nr:hypothetical protein SAMN05444514_103386 [Pseudomonas syringae]SFL71921.1 hypothetical protein SAMN05444064_103386 [Pseudomonas syringae]
MHHLLFPCVHEGWRYCQKYLLILKVAFAINLPCSAVAGVVEMATIRNRGSVFVKHSGKRKFAVRAIQPSAKPSKPNPMPKPGHARSKAKSTEASLSLASRLSIVLAYSRAARSHKACASPLQSAPYQLRQTSCGSELAHEGGGSNALFQGLPFINSLIDTSPRSLRSTKASIRKIKRLEALKHHPLATRIVATLTSSDFARYCDERLMIRKDNTVKRELALFQCVIEVARREWGIHLAENPVRMVSRPSYNDERSRRLDPIEEQYMLGALELRELRADGTYADASHNPWIRPIVQLAIETTIPIGSHTVSMSGG